MDDLISMSDGQVWFNDDNDNTEKQHSPPVNAQRSITRVGIGADTQSRADAPAIRRIAEGVRLDLAQSASMEGAEQMTASASQSRRERGWLLALHQEKDDTRVLSESCIALLAASMSRREAASTARPGLNQISSTQSKYLGVGANIAIALSSVCHASLLY